MQPHARYRQVQATTASPGELLLSLYDGIFRFTAGAQVCFEKSQLAAGSEQCSKAHAIVSELRIALDPSVAPDLCANLGAVYDFALTRLSEAQRHHDQAALQDVRRVLTPLREAFRLAVPRAAAERIGAPSGTRPAAAAAG